MTSPQDPRPPETPQPPFPGQQQRLPGLDQAMAPQADHGEASYRGHGRLQGKAALITGGDSGIGKAVAIAFAREGADVLVSYLESEEADARDTEKWVTEAGRKAVLMPGDIACPDHCAALVAKAVEAFGRLDVLVNNAAHQRTFDHLEDISDEEIDRTFKVNIISMFHLCKAAAPHLKPGASIINTSSREAFTPRPDLLAYATTKGAIATFTKSLAGLLADRGIRVNAVAPGPVWTPLIPASMKEEEVRQFGTSTPWGRPAQPVELAPVYVLLASDESSYISSSIYEVTGGRPVS